MPTGSGNQTRRQDQGQATSGVIAYATPPAHPLSRPIPPIPPPPPSPPPGAFRDTRPRRFHPSSALPSAGALHATQQEQQPRQTTREGGRPKRCASTKQAKNGVKKKKRSDKWSGTPKEPLTICTRPPPKLSLHGIRRASRKE